MKKYTIVLWFFLAFSVPLALSAQSITIRDTTVQRGTIFPVDVIAEGIPEGQRMSLKVEYNYNLLHLVRAEGAGNRIMQCMLPDVKATDRTEGKLDTLEVSCSAIKPAATSGVLFTLYFEALAGPDSVVAVETYGFAVDGTETLGVAYRPGKISIPGIPVFPQPNESLSQSYPNPFGFFTTFDYTADDDVNVEFRVYSLAGRHVDEADYKIVRTDRTLSIEPGFNMANGAYLMQMRTDNGVYQVPFFFIR